MSANPTAEFTCANCRQRFPTMHAGQPNFACIGDHKQICHQCAADRTKTRMIVDGKATLYLNHNRSEIGDFTGLFRLPIARMEKFRHPLHRSAWLVYFKGPDDAAWSGRNIGDNDVLHVRRLKRAPKR